MILGVETGCETVREWFFLYSGDRAKVKGLYLAEH